MANAYRNLKKGRQIHLSQTTRAGYYLDAANQAGALVVREPDAQETRANRLARKIYNKASGELTALLRGNPSLWRPGAPIPSPTGSGVYQLQFVSPGGKQNHGFWSPSYFTRFQPADKINMRGLRKHFQQDGFGGALVGVRDARDLGQRKDPFAYEGSVNAAVTATLNFQPPDATGKRPVTLSLYDPTVRDKAPVLEQPRPLAADFTAPIASYPRSNELVAGVLSMIQAEKYLKKSGVFMCQPYDPKRIPVIFIHGLASTPQMWVNDINEIEGDPDLRGRFQYWVVSYPSGTPVSYTSMRVREDLAAIEKKYPSARGYVVVGHSMGGLVGKMQAITTGRTLWNADLGENADRLYAKLPADNALKKTLIFEANPKVERLIFICVPHRGSDLAGGTIGRIATGLITLPITLVNTFTDALGTSVNLLTGGKNERWPTSIQSLSPNNPTLLALDRLPIRASYNSIIGDRGRGDTPNSSDGVVPYWSSHLEGAQSELIVPGSHSSSELPQTVAEIRRILTREVKPPGKARGSKTPFTRP